MCPPGNPSPPLEIGLYFNEDQIFALLNGYKPDTHLPTNVLTDFNPYIYPPSNLPEGVWYLVSLNEKKESDHGFWKAKGDACKIYSNSVITGSRTTLEYFEGQAPHGRKTNWIMQEYIVTQKESSDKDKSKDSKLVCRVFLCSGTGSKGEMHLQNLKATTELKRIDSISTMDAIINSISAHESQNESKATGALTGLDVKNSDSYPPLLSMHEYIQRGDFLELDDLEDPESHSSSSQNSSCPSNLSDKYFDSLALLREIEGEENKTYQSRQASSKYDVAPPVKSDDVVLQPVSSGMSGSVKFVEDPQPGSAALSSLIEKGKQQLSPKGHSSDDSIAGSSTPSSSDKNPGPSERKKSAASGSRRMKKLKTYFCFASFN